MKQFKHKKILALGGLGLGVLLLTSCTANFCSPTDQSAMAYPYDQGVTVYLTKSEYDALKADNSTKAVIELEEQLSATAQMYGLPTVAGPAFVDSTYNALNEKVYKYVPLTVGEGETPEFKLEKAAANKYQGFLKDLVANAMKAGYALPSLYYYSVIDDYVLRAATTEYFVTRQEGNASYVYANNTDFEAKLPSFKADLASVYVGNESDFDSTKHVAVNPYVLIDPSETCEEINASRSILRERGKVKFTGYSVDGNGNESRPFCENLEEWDDELRLKAIDSAEILGVYDIPTVDYLNYYKQQIAAKVSAVRSCIATREGYFGHYGTNADWRVSIESKDWGYAWKKGFLEGLLVYPVTWLLDTMAFGFDANLTGVGQIWALIIVTLIVRGLLLAVSWRSTMDNQKMQALQPELAKLQQKYPNANTNQADKQRMSQEQMMLYRRHGIKPFRQIIFMIIQFPVFICVWAGLQGSAALSTGEVLNMRLSDNINTILFNTKGTWYLNTTGWWTALVLFILMAGTQIMAMLLPKLLAKKSTKDVAKLAKSQTNNTMKFMSYGLIIFTIIMGFFLPSAMGIYWLIGGLISMVQTLITQAIMAKAKKGRK